MSRPELLKVGDKLLFEDELCEIVEIDESQEFPYRVGWSGGYDYYTADELEDYRVAV
jgi:hypothetical protein